MTKAIQHTSEATDIKDLEMIKKGMKWEKEYRKLIKKYIQEELKEGEDYGTIEIQSKKSGKVYKSKPILFKAGAEKLLKIFHLTCRWVRDDETWEMFGKKPGVVCLKCEILNKKGEVVAEGRGVGSLEMDRDPNVAVKLAEKRSKVDAVINLFGISDYFSQDEEIQERFKQEKQSFEYPKSEVKTTPTKLVQTETKRCPECFTSGRFHKPGCSYTGVNFLAINKGETTVEEELKRVKELLNTPEEDKKEEKQKVEGIEIKSLI